MPDMPLESLLARQAGVISRDQAIGAGLTRDAVDHRLRLRRWRPLHPRVYLVNGHRFDDEVRVRAAVLWAGDGAVLSGVAAAWWHGMVDEAPATIGLTVGRRTHSRPRPGLDLRRRELRPEDHGERRGLAVTAPALTVLDAAVELGASGGGLLDRALQRWVAFPAVYEAHRRNLGSAGAASAGRMLVMAADRSAAAAERVLVRMLRGSGAAGWLCAFPAAGQRVAVAFPAARVAIQVNGWAWRIDDERTERREALARRGWTVVRFSWQDLTARPRAVLAEIASAVAAGSGITDASASRDFRHVARRRVGAPHFVDPATDGL
jgi:very-short-patch-repair endonuclease